MIDELVVRGLGFYRRKAVDVEKHTLSVEKVDACRSQEGNMAMIWSFVKQNFGKFCKVIVYVGKVTLHVNPHMHAWMHL